MFSLYKYLFVISVRFSRVYVAEFDVPLSSSFFFFFFFFFCNTRALVLFLKKISFDFKFINYFKIGLSP